jgi:putative peptidoglycan lipid II flippase
VLPSSDAVYGLVFANSFAFLAGWVVGEVWLHARLGSLGTRRIARTIGKSVVASVAAGVVAWIVHKIAPSSTAGAWLSLILGGGIGIAVAFGVLTLLRTPELNAVRRRIAR